MNAKLALFSALSSSLLLGAWACGSNDDGGVTLTGGNSSTASSSSGAVNTSSSASSSSSSSSSSGMPLTCDEEYSTVTKGPCDLLAQDCPPGQWCTVGGDPPTTICAPDNGGLKGPGEACAMDTECKAPSRCIDDKCSPPCCPSTDKPCEGGRCDINLSYTGGVSVRHCSYATTCKLFAGDCPRGEYCHISDQDQGLSVCDTPSSNFAMEGEECFYRNDCGESQYCNKNGDDRQTNKNGICRHLCNVKDDQQPPGKGGCAPMRSCSPVNAGAFMDIGLCLP